MRVGNIQWESVLKRVPKNREVTSKEVPVVAGSLGPTRSEMAPLTGPKVTVKIGAAMNKIPIKEGESRRTSWR